MTIAGELAELFLYQSDIEMHPLKCVTTMLECIAAAGLQTEFPYSRLQDAARDQITVVIGRDAENWSGYSCKPSFFIKSPESLGYPEIHELLIRELNHLLDIRNPQGIWDLTWSWAAYEKEFAISENWWKASVAIENLLLLRAFQRLSPITDKVRGH